MYLVSFSIRTKGAHNFTRRLGTVFTRLGFSEAPIRYALHTIIDSLQQYNGAPTFFIPAVVPSRHPALIAEIARDGAEIGVHGYVHTDYRTLSKDEQYKQTKQAISIFERIKFPYRGFRNPYLGWTEESLGIYAALGFSYESNLAVLHDVVDLNSFSPLLRYEQGYPAMRCTQEETLAYAMYLDKPEGLGAAGEEQYERFGDVEQSKSMNVYLVKTFATASQR